MYDQLAETIQQKVKVKPDEMEAIKTYFTPRKLKKRHFILNEGEVCKYNIFVETGLLRLFALEKDGYEQTVQFASEGWWMADLSSFLSGEPADHAIEALEDSDVLLLTLDSFNKMTDDVPCMDRYFRLLMQNHIIAQRRRIVAALRHTAEERYSNFMQKMPSLINRVPQQQIASFLGMTPETLSRIRKNLAS